MFAFFEPLLLSWHGLGTSVLWSGNVLSTAPSCSLPGGSWGSLGGAGRAGRGCTAPSLLAAVLGLKEAEKSPPSKPLPPQPLQLGLNGR